MRGWLTMRGGRQDLWRARLRSGEAPVLYAAVGNGEKKSRGGGGVTGVVMEHMARQG